jgi:hypothetical protein
VHVLSVWKGFARVWLMKPVIKKCNCITAYKLFVHGHGHGHGHELKYYPQYIIGLLIEL